jgi:hypothetical protein
MTEQTGKELCVVVGAGASYGARLTDHYQQPPPLGKDLADYLYHWYTANELAGRVSYDGPTERKVGLAMIHETNPSDTSRPGGDIFDRETADRKDFLELCDWTKAASEVGFEQLAAQLIRPRADTEVEYQRSIKRVLWRVLAFSMLNGEGCRFTEGPDLYDQLLESFKGRYGRISFVSFNYDLLLEEAIERVFGETVAYPGLRLLGTPRETAYKVYKPHGSINWFPVSNIVVSADGRRPERPSKLVQVADDVVVIDTHNEYDKLPRNHCILELKAPRLPAPLIAVYCEGKPPVRNPLCFEEVRAQAHETLSRADEVLIIGVHPPSEGNVGDDPFLEAAFERLREVPAVSYVSPQIEETERVEQLVGGATTHKMTFSAYVEYLNRQ